MNDYAQEMSTERQLHDQLHASAFPAKLSGAHLLVAILICASSFFLLYLHEEEMRTVESNVMDTQELHICIIFFICITEVRDKCFQKSILCV